MAKTWYISAFSSPLKSPTLTSVRLAQHDTSDIKLKGSIPCSIYYHQPQCSFHLSASVSPFHSYQRSIILPPPPQPPSTPTSPAWCLSSHIPPMTPWLIRKTPWPSLHPSCPWPVSMHYSLGFLKVTLGLLGLSAVWSWGALSISLQRISPLPSPGPLGFYACVPGCESECTLSQVDRAFIHSTLKVCR